MNQVGVIGLWHLGLVSLAGLADLGYSVRGFDANPKLLRELEEGKLPLFEPGLDELLRKHRKSSRISLAKNYQEAVSQAEAILITYDTPVDNEDRADLTILDETIKSVAPHLPEESLLIINSQIPVGSSRRWQAQIDKARPGASIDLVYSPENLRLGQALEIFKHPDMIVIGFQSERARKKVERFYKPFSSEKFYVSWETAEMAKHALNAFLGTSISVANELAKLCEAVGADGLEVARILKQDSRVGKKAQVIPGLGFAGATVARDLRALQKLGDNQNVPTPLFDSVLEVNQRQIERVIEITEQYFGGEGELEGKVLTLFGLTYKPGTSTLRRSASLEIIQRFQAKGSQIRAHDPKADLSELKEPLTFGYSKDPYEASSGSQGIVLVTEWPEYRDLDYARIKEKMAHPFILDTKNFLDADKLVKLGYVYLAIGRGQLEGVNPAPARRREVKVQV